MKGEIMNSFEDIYRLYYSDTYNFINKLANYDHHIAEELTQETFYHVYLSFHKFKGDSHIKTWILTIAKNRYFMYLRANKTTLISTETILDLSDEKISIEDTILQRELLEFALSTIFEMPPPMKDVFISRIFTRKSYIEISDTLNISVSSAKVLFFRGKSKLKSRLKEKYGYEI
jgi:RNA polymerase sigma-70 factor (ECF subfamily)